jgi:TRAP-type C4-dicarboxylate transport system permease small subunit
LTTTTPTTTTGGGGAKQSLGPIQRTTSCVSLSAAGGGCSTSNVAVPIGLVALGLVFLLAAWDYVRQRRRAQLLGQEVTA